MAEIVATGSSSGLAQSVAVAVTILTAGGSALGQAVASGGAVRIIRSPVLLAAGSSAVMAAGIRQLAAAGTARGKSDLSAPSAARYTIMSGTARGSAGAEAFVTDRDIAEAIRSYVPDFLQRSALFTDIQSTQAVELIRLFSMLEGYRRELLDEPQSSQPPMTLGAYTNMVNSFYKSKVLPLLNDYLVRATIYEVRGIPQEINEMRHTADKALPAHLEYEFEPTYLPWDEIEEVALTWNQAEQIQTWDQLETTFLIPVEEVLRRNGIE